MDKVLKRMELARTGSFGPDGSAVTLQNLQDVVDTFDGKCPVSLGHYMTKQDWWPSWGNVETIELVKDVNGIDGVLHGDVSMQPVLAEAINSGFYTGWSISIPARASDNKRYLHHLAMLGSVPPKIRELKLLASVEAKPDNAIDPKGVGMDFSDQAFFNFSDFEKKGEKEVKTSTDPKQPPTAKPAEAPVAVTATDFADDQLKGREERAKAAYKSGTQAKVVGEIGNRWPAGKKDELCEFADKLVDVHDYDFADEGENKGKSLVDLFIGLIKGMSPAAIPPTGRSKEFSDTGTNKPAESVDRASMANKF
jgi:hypothetical protein